jgi:hypothetical protein
MNKSVYILILIFINISFRLSAQTAIPDSEIADTSGMERDLSAISANIGLFPDSILRELKCIKVKYFGFDPNGFADTTKLRAGILVVSSAVEEDLIHIFKELQELRFPIAKVVPINKYGLNADTTGWNDGASMEDNNTSAFNYRYITLSTELSPHAFGTAIDFNPLFNPYEKYHHDGKFVEPAHAFYDLSRPGTIADGRIVGIFDKRGWVWGGRWNNPVDYQHFDLRKDRGRKHYLMKHSGLKDRFRYGEKDNSLIIYASVTDKKMEKPEISVLESERKTFAAMMDALSADSCYSAWQSGKKDSLIGSKDFKSSSDPKQRLKGLNVAIYMENDSLMHYWNRFTAQKLKNLLLEQGARVDFLSDSDNNKGNYQLAIGIGLGNRNMYDTENALTADFQLLYVPGAYLANDLNSISERMHFLNLLLSDDLPESIKLAQKIQTSIQDRTALYPVSRQLPGPNLLESDCIKSDVDGIYCRNISQFNYFACPQVFVSAFSIQNQSDMENWLQPKNGFLNCEKLAEAVFNGILGYCE